MLRARGNVTSSDNDGSTKSRTRCWAAEDYAEEPDADKLPANTARLRWLRPDGPSATPAQGLEHADLVVDGETVGHVEVGWEVDPFAVPLIQIANRAGGRGRASSCGRYPGPGRQRRRQPPERHAPAEAGPRPAGRPRTGAADHRAAPGLRLDRHVGRAGHRRRRRCTRRSQGGHPVERRHRRRHRPRRRGPHPVGAARRASRPASRWVNLAKGGTTLAGLLLVTGNPQGPTNPMSIRRWLESGQHRRSQRAGVRGVRRHQSAAATRSDAATADRLACPRPGNRLRPPGRPNPAAGHRAGHRGLATRHVRPVRQPVGVAAPPGPARPGGRLLVRDTDRLQVRSPRSWPWAPRPRQFWAATSTPSWSAGVMAVNALIGGSPAAAGRGRSGRRIVRRAGTVRPSRGHPDRGDGATPTGSPPQRPNASSPSTRRHCGPATSSTWPRPTWCPPMPVCWWPRTSRWTNRC